MKFAFCLISILYTVPGRSQTPSSALTQQETEYYTFVLMTIGNLDDTPDLRQTHEQLLVQRHAFSTPQAQALHSASVDFNGGLARIESARAQLISTLGELAASDPVINGPLITQRNQLVGTLISRLNQQLGPAAAKRFRQPLDWYLSQTQGN